MHIEWTDEQLAEAGIDKKRLKSIIRKLEAASAKMEGTGLHVYGESGFGHLVHRSRPEHFGREREADFGAVIANVGPGFDGGGW